MLPALAEAYARVLNAQQGRVTAEAVTAVPLAEAQQGRSPAPSRTTVGKTVELHARSTRPCSAASS